MKRFFVFIILAAMLLGGCGSQGQQMKEPVTFYYLRDQYRYGNSQSIMDGEEREVSGHHGDLRYLMALYLLGPSSEELRCPLPLGTRILSAEQEDGRITLTLSEVPASMTDTTFSLACACLSRTCLSLTEADSVTVISGSRSITMDANNLVLTDNLQNSETEETQ